MFLFSKKGGILLLITLGVLLSIGGPAQARTCLDCYDAATCNAQPVNTRDCPAGVDLCVRSAIKDGDGNRIHTASCAGDSHGTALGCTKTGVEDFVDCLCDTDLCNTKDIVTTGEGTGGTGSATEASGGTAGGTGGGSGGEGGAKSGVSTPVLSASRFGVLALSSALLLIGLLSP